MQRFAPRPLPVGTGGCDAHENTFTQLMPDGERGDSFRRMMIWHTHHLLVDSVDRDGIMEALGRGRLYLTFEVLGTPVEPTEPCGGAEGSVGEEGAGHRPLSATGEDPPRVVVRAGMVGGQGGQALHRLRAPDAELEIRIVPLRNEDHGLLHPLDMTQRVKAGGGRGEFSKGTVCQPNGALESTVLDVLPRATPTLSSWPGRDRRAARPRP